MRLIDADVLPEISLFGTTEYINVRKAPTVPAVPLDRIKEDITALDNAYEDLDGYDPDALGTYKCRVDEVFSKLIAEVEGKDATERK